MYEKIREYFENNEEQFCDYCEAFGILTVDEVYYPMDEFDCFFHGSHLLDLAKLIYNGNFNPNDKYFSMGVYLESHPERDYIEYYLTESVIEEMADYIEWEYKKAPKNTAMIYSLYIEAGLIEPSHCN